MILLPGSIIVMIMSKIFAHQFGNIGIGFAFAVGGCISAIMMIIFANREMSGTYEKVYV